MRLALHSVVVNKTSFTPISNYSTKKTVEGFNVMPVLRGQLTVNELDSLISLTKIRSSLVKKALKSHLVDGKKQKECEAIFKVRQSLISRNVKALRLVEETVQSIVRKEEI